MDWGDKEGNTAGADMAVSDEYYVTSFFLLIMIKIKINHHAVSRTQQGRQREPSVETLHSGIAC